MVFFFVCRLLVLSVFRHFLPIFVSSSEILVRCLAHTCITCFLDFFGGLSVYIWISCIRCTAGKVSLPFCGFLFYHFFVVVVWVVFFKVCRSFFYFMKTPLSIIGLNSWKILIRKSFLSLYVRYFQCFGSVL